MVMASRFASAGLIAALAAAALGLSGCGRDRPAAVIDKGTTRVAAPAGKAAPPSGRRYVVRRGDTIYAISRRTGAPIRAIVARNDLRAPFRLKEGRSLSLPPPARHRVVKGETVYSIARAYDVSQSGLVRLNAIRSPYLIREGQVLKLPGGQGAAIPPTPRAKAAAPVARKPAGDSSRVGRSSGAKPPPRTSRRFAWPLQGQVISKFGPKPGGRYNDGINIAAATGAAVRASEAGVVAYAGNELPGFGNLLLIRHAGGWMTAYAHNRDLAVRAGQKVKRGQLIARVGATGSVRRTQLHFEIRKGRHAFDPLRYLAGARAGG